MKAYPLIGVIATLAIVPAIFADTTGTGATTSTGSTSTGTVTSTGTTATGVTSTGTIVSTGTTLSGSTNTGTTSTGTVVSTGTTSTGTSTRCLVQSGAKIDRIAAQQAYLSGMIQLLSNKKTAYQVSLTLSGSGKIAAIKAANETFRLGVKDLQKTLRAAKHNFRDDVMCKKVEKEGKRSEQEDRKSEKNEKKIEKSVKKIEKEIRKISKKIK